MSFDTILPMHASPNSKWAGMKARYGVDPTEGIAMNVADSDYPTAPCVTEALLEAVRFGPLGYGYDKAAYLEAVRWWMASRHGWEIDPDWIVTAQGLGHAIGTCIDIWSAPGEGVAYFTPVYHEFRNKTVRAGRTPVELPLALVEGRYELDFEAAAAALTPDTRVLLFCSPQNPSGRIWTADELRAVADFAEKHDLLLVSDEVHADLLYDGNTNTPMDKAAPQHRGRTITLYAASKTFNLAGLRVGQMIIPDPQLRAKVADRMTALNYDPATLGVLATEKALSPEGAAWVAEQMAHLAHNRDVLDSGLNAIPGVRSMRLQSTFLPWVDFSGTGMDEAEVARRIHQEAKVATQPGTSFGTGGALHQRFNIALPKAQVAEAVARVQRAFADLQ